MAHRDQTERGSGAGVLRSAEAHVRSAAPFAVVVGRVTIAEDVQVLGRAVAVARDLLELVVLAGSSVPVLEKDFAEGRRRVDIPLAAAAVDADHADVVDDPVERRVVEVVVDRAGVAVVEDLRLALLGSRREPARVDALAAAAGGGELAEADLDGQVDGVVRGNALLAAVVALVDGFALGLAAAACANVDGDEIIADAVGAPVPAFAEGAREVGLAVVRREVLAPREAGRAGARFPAPRIAPARLGFCPAQPPARFFPLLLFAPARAGRRLWWSVDGQTATLGVGPKPPPSTPPWCKRGPRTQSSVRNAGTPRAYRFRELGSVRVRAEEAVVALGVDAREAQEAKRRLHRGGGADLGVVVGDGAEERSGRSERAMRTNAPSQRRLNKRRREGVMDTEPVVLPGEAKSRKGGGFVWKATHLAR